MHPKPWENLRKGVPQPYHFVGFVLALNGSSQTKWRKKERLFAVHVRDDSSQLGCVRGRQLINSVFQTLLADGAYLINGYFGCLSRTGYLES